MLSPHQSRAPLARYYVKGVWLAVLCVAHDEHSANAIEKSAMQPRYRTDSAATSTLSTGGDGNAEASSSGPDPYLSSPNSRPSKRERAKSKFKGVIHKDKGKNEVCGEHRASLFIMSTAQKLWLFPGVFVQ
jgi:hypothetical protein